MTTYRIDPRKNGGDVFDVEAETHGEAAQTAAKTIFPKIAGMLTLHKMRAIRQTGDPAGSGMYKVYGAGNPKSDYGSAFHVMEL